MTKKQKSYQETYASLQMILSTLERDSVSIDELSESLNKGFDLLEELKSRLTATEARVEAVISARTESKSKTQTEHSETD